MKRKLFIVLLFLVLTGGCGKKQEKMEFIEGEVKATSSFSNNSYSFNCRLNQIEDGSIQYDYFNSDYSITQMMELFDSNDIVESGSDFIRIIDDNEYFILIIIDSYDDYNEYKFSSDRSAIASEEYLLTIPFPQNNGINLTEEYSFENLTKEYLIEYYSRLNYEFLNVTNDCISFEAITNIKKENEKYNIRINIKNQIRFSINKI